MGLSTHLKPTSYTSIFLYLCLRGLHIGACAIAGFNFCYIVWQHNNHYCAVHPRNCAAWQMYETKVPVVYIWLIAMIVASILSAFIFSFTHLKEVLNTLIGYTPFPSHPISLPSSPPPPPSHHGNTEPELPNQLLPLYENLQALFSTPATAALTIDASILIVFAMAFNEYTWSIVWGRVLPYCWLWKSYRGDQGEYWKNLRVMDKECIIGQCAWVSSCFALGFSVLIVGLEIWYLKCEWDEKKGGEEGMEAVEPLVLEEEKK